MDAILNDHREVIRKNLKFLRDYAQQSLVDGKDLTSVENIKDIVLREFYSVGRSFKLTDRDIALMVFRDIWSKQGSKRLP